MERRLLAALQGLVAERSRQIVIIFGLAALVAAALALGLRIDTSVDGLMPVGDPDRVLNRELKEDFSNDEVLVVAFELGAPFTPQDLRQLDELADRVRNIEGVEEVLDLASIEDVRGMDGFLDASSLVDFATIDADIDAVRLRARGHRLYEGKLVSDALDVLAMIVIFKLPSEFKASMRAATGDVLELLETAPWPAYASGYPVNEYRADRIARRDVALLTPPAFLAILAVVFLAFRRRASLMLLTVVVVWSELCMVAWLGASGTAVNMVTSSVPPILLATSSTYAIYLLGLLQKVSHEEKPGVSVVALLLRPTLLSSASTSAGFLSLRLFDVQAIQELGAALTVGILAAAAGTLLLLPALVHLYGVRLDSTRLPRLEAWSVVGVRFSRRPLLTVGIALAILAGSVPGIRSIAVDSDPMRYFSGRGAHRQADEFIERHLAGTGVVNVAFRTGEADGALEPVVTAVVDRVIHEVERSPIVDQTISFLDYTYLMDAAMRPGAEPRTVLPTQELLAQYMLVYEAGGDPADYRHYVNHDRSGLNVFIRTNSLASSDILGLAEQIYAVADTQVEGVEVHVLGSLTLLGKAMDQIVRGMITGLGTALVLIAVVLALGLGSLRMALIAILPNVAPIVVFGGLIGWAGIPLSVGTAVVGCVALGLAVDDTAHVLGHTRLSEPLVATYRLVGTPITLTTISLSLGFGFLALSEFEPVSILGMATVVTLVVALLFDLLVLPSLLVLIGYKRGLDGELDGADA